MVALTLAPMSETLYPTASISIVTFLLMVGACASPGNFDPRLDAGRDAARDAPPRRDTNPMAPDGSRDALNDTRGDAPPTVTFAESNLIEAEGMVALAGDWSRWISAHIRPNGALVVVYRYMTSDIQGLYMRELPVGGQWSPRQLIDDRTYAGDQVSAAMDTQGRLHIAYRRDVESIVSYVREITPGGALTLAVDLPGTRCRGPSIVTRANGNALVTYVNTSLDNLYIAEVQLQNGAVVDLGHSLVAREVSSAAVSLASNGDIVVAYNSLEGFLWTTVRTSGGASFTGPIQRGESNIGLGPHIASNDSASTAVAFFDDRGYDLELLRLNAPVSEPMLIDGTGSAGKISSIAFDATGRLHIAYCDATNSDLRYTFVEPDGTMGVPQAADQQGTVGQSPSIVVDGTGTVHLIYAGDGELRYMRGTP